MELDVAAWFAYAMVLLIAFYTAGGQVNKLLGVPGKWRYGEAYILWAVFVFLPVALFWALDRVGAIHDSSLISAFVVAFSYTAIIQKSSPVQSSAVSAVFQPVLNWASTLRQTLGEAISRSDSAFASAVTVTVGNDAQLLPVLESWAMAHIEDPATLAKRLQDFENKTPDPVKAGTAAPGSLAHLDWCRDKAARIVAFLRGTPLTRIRFARLGLTPWSSLWSALIPYRPVARYGMTTLVILIIGFTAWKWVYKPLAGGDSQTPLQVFESMVSMRTIRPAYDHWRYLKAGNTPTDVQRALADLRAGLALELPSDSGPQARSTPAEFAQTFITIFEDQALTKAQAESLLRVVISGRLSNTGVACPALKMLAQALRSQSVTTRALVASDLASASESFWKGTNAALLTLKVGADAGHVDLEGAVNAWTQYLTTQCAAPTLTAGVPAKPPSAEPSSPPNKPDPIPEGKVEIERRVLSDVNFDTDSDTLHITAFKMLDGLADELSARRELRVAIDGYTDSTGGRRYNVDLSWRRANAVRDYLQYHGVAPNQVTTHGFGAADPVADNETKEGRARNRRVVMKIEGPTGGS